MDLIQQLKNLKKNQPGENYSRQSLASILTYQPLKNNFQKKEHGIWLNFRPILGGVLTLILISSFIFYYFLTFKNNLIAEANQINNSIQINLSQLQMNLNNNKQISSTEIQKIRDTLNQVNKELEEAKNISQESKKSEELVQKIKTAKLLLIQINSEIK